MPRSAEHAVAAIEQHRIDTMMAADINTRNEIIDEQCTHIELKCYRSQPMLACMRLLLL